jgi:hypothetical protein
VLRLLVALLMFTALPQTAHAAFGEVVPLELHDDECVRPTGVPGQLALATDRAVRFYGVARDGFTPRERVEFVWDGLGCATTSVRTTGAGVIAARHDGRVVIRPRDPGGTWLPVVALEPTAETYVSGVAAAVSDRGDVLVTWREDDASGRQTVRAARRAPGEAFGVPATLGRSTRSSAVVPALTAAGEAIVLITRSPARGGGQDRPVTVTMAASGAPFGAPVTIANVAANLAPSLAVAPDGRALVALADERSVLVAERPPGGAFGPPAALADVRGDRTLAVEAALAADGAAAITWQRTFPLELATATRPGPGAFGPERSIGSSPWPRRLDPLLVILLDQVLGPFDAGDAPLPAAPITPDGRALSTWWDDTRLPEAPTLNAAPLTGGGVTRFVGSRSVQGTSDEFPLLLADGTPGLVWTAGEQLHFAAEGVVTPASPPLPRVRLEGPRSRVLGPEDTLRLPVHCSGPCVVSASAGVSLLPNTDELTLPRGGRGTLEIAQAAALLAAPRWRVPVRLDYGAPGGFDARSRTVEFILQRAPDTPDTRVRSVRAVRRGSRIHVTWSTAGRAGTDSSFWVTATKTRDRAEAPIVFRDLDAREGRRTFSVTLRAGRDVRWVAVRSDESFVTGRPSFARVR